MYTQLFMVILLFNVHAQLSCAQNSLQKKQSLTTVPKADRDQLQRAVKNVECGKKGAAFEPMVIKAILVKNHVNVSDIQDPCVWVKQELAKLDNSEVQEASCSIYADVSERYLHELCSKDLLEWQKKPLLALQEKQRKAFLDAAPTPPFNYTFQVDISGLDKAVVIKALFDHAEQWGANSAFKWQRTLAYFRKQIEDGQMSFYVIDGRSLYVDVSEDNINVSIYNEQNGSDAGQKVIAALRAGRLKY